MPLYGLFSVAINGILVDYFGSARDTYQGDPL